MDEYFLTKKATEIILDNLNEHFIKCLISLSVKERYVENMRLIIDIVELVKSYLSTRRNDLLSSCIKYTNKGYYIQLSDSLFRLIQNHLTNTIENNKYIFINDLITKYNNPFIPSSTTITRNFKDTYRNRFNSTNNSYDNENYYDNDTRYNFNEKDNEHIKDVKDAGTLFKEAYNKLKTNKMNKNKDIELSNITINSGDDLV
jgi:hypothetical protein